MSNRLPILFGKVTGLHREVLDHTDKAAETAIAAGAALVEAKGLCQHGEWGTWLKSTGLSERTAQRYMKLHKGGCNSAIVADLGIARAERLSSLGLRLWPNNGKGTEISALGDDSSCYHSASITPFGGNLARYWACYLFPDKTQDFYVIKTVSKPLALGILCEGNESHFDIYNEKRLTPKQTRNLVAEIEGEWA